MLKLADNIVTIFELAFGALGIAVWASLGFPVLEAGRGVCAADRYWHH
jgi:hypothetical protein